MRAQGIWQVPTIAPGGALDTRTRQHFGAALGFSFAHVRIHTDPAADRAARSLGARAFTVGRDIFFRAGQYQPDSVAGRRLIAHELVHVVQQRAAPAAGPGMIVYQATPAQETQARDTARKLVESAEAPAPAVVTPERAGRAAAIPATATPTLSLAPDNGVGLVSAPAEGTAAQRVRAALARPDPVAGVGNPQEALAILRGLDLDTLITALVDLDREALLDQLINALAPDDRSLLAAAIFTVRFTSRHGTPDDQFGVRAAQGREWDASIGFYHFHARHYDPTRGRFLQRDPLESEPQRSAYQAFKSSPMMYVDPMGTSPVSHERPPPWGGTRLADPQHSRGYWQLGPLGLIEQPDTKPMGADITPMDAYVQKIENITPTPRLGELYSDKRTDYSRAQLGLDLSKLGLDLFGSLAWYLLSGALLPFNAIQARASTNFWHAAFGSGEPITVPQRWALGDPAWRAGYLSLLAASKEAIRNEVEKRVAEGHWSGSQSYTSPRAANIEASEFGDRFFASGHARFTVDVQYSWVTVANSRVVVTEQAKGHFRDVYLFDEGANPSESRLQREGIIRPFILKGDWSEPPTSATFPLATSNRTRP